MTSSFDLVLSRARESKGSGNKYTAFCPAHDDKNSRSLSITREDGRVLAYCFAGCSFEEIASAMELELADFFDDKKNGGGGGPSIPPNKTATVQHLGCTLEQYAEYKRLPVDYLRSLGIRDIVVNGFRVLRIPYTDDGPVRFRHTITGDNRFSWKSGSKLCLYGLSRLNHAREAGYVVLVEGESDSHTLWHHKIPALGIPGATNWREDRDAQHLEGIDTIFVVHEPDKGGEAVIKWLGKSNIRHRVRLVELGDYKDPSGLHLDSPDLFKERWQKVLDSSTPWDDYATEHAEAERKNTWELCHSIAQSSDILDEFWSEIERGGLVGEKRACKLLYLIVTTRLLEKIVSATIKGPSSAGKSHVLDKVLGFFPSTAYYALSAMSERALAYSDVPVEHRFLVVYEAVGMSGDFASYLIRSLLSEGRIRYETVEKTREGMKPRLIEREGPTGLLVTTTAAKLHPENETRLFSIPVLDTQEQTRRIFNALADEELPESPDLSKWQALQSWLQGGEARVTIPYGKFLAEKIPPIAVRLRRDFGAILALIRAHAILHQVNRDKDAQGRIIADIEHDYANVRDLVEDLVSEGVDSTVSQTIRETVGAVKALNSAGLEEVTIAQMRGQLQLDKSSASRRATVAREAGYLKNLEDRRRRPARYVLGDPLPEDLEILPTVDTLLAMCCSVAGETGRYVPPLPPVEQPIPSLPVRNDEGVV